MLRKQLCALAFLATLPVGSMLAQGTVWTVDDDGPADFDNMFDAVAAAASGDVILIEDGAYSGLGFTIDGKSLSLIADGSNVDINNISIVVQNLAAGQKVVFRGIDGAGTRFDLRNNTGTVWIEEGYWNFSGSSSSAIPRIAATSSAAVNILRCNVLGEQDSLGYSLGAALTASASNVHVYDSEFAGGAAGLFLPAVPAVTVTNGTVLFASACEFKENVDLFTGATIPGLILGAGDPDVYLLDTLATPDVTSGTVTTIAEEARHYRVPSPQRVGETALLTYEGDPTDLVIIGIATDAVGVLSLPFSGVIMHSPIPANVVLVPGNPPPFGILQVPIVVPPIPLGLDSVELTTQALSLTPTGKILFTEASYLTILAPGL